MQAKKRLCGWFFNSRLKLEFHGSKVTSDAKLLAYRELNAALGLTDLGDELLNDWRTEKNTQHLMLALMRLSNFSRLAVYEDTNDGERLSVEPTMQQVVFQMAEMAVPRELFRTILTAIDRLRPLVPACG